MFRTDEFRKKVNTTAAMVSRTLENKLNVLYKVNVTLSRKSPNILVLEGLNFEEKKPN